MTQNTGPTSDPFEPFESIDGKLDCGVLLICDHARNTIPSRYDNLGMPKKQLDRHIGYDIGARAVTLGLAERLGAPAVLSTFSRLLIDPNRGEDDPTLVMRLSDGAVVPGNARISRKEKQERIALFHKPYHDEISRVLDCMIAVAPPPVIVSIHSFTPIWRGVPRPWHATVLWDSDPRAVEPMMAGLRRQADLIVADNEPYDGALKNDTMYRHATVRGVAQVLLEIRQDLIATDAGAQEWVGRLAPILLDLAKRPECRELKFFTSRSDQRFPVGSV